MKNIPTNDSVDFLDFWANEHDKAEYGLTVNGVFISGWLYWHTQLWNIYIDEEDPRNPTVIKRIFKKAQFRDNEWIIDGAMQEAQRDKKGIMIFGSRRLGKSEFLSSHIARHSTLYDGSENIITGGNWGDIDVIMYKITQGLNGLPDYFKFGRLQENLRKEIELGFKDKKGTRTSWSKIIARNHEDGLKTEAVAGLTASTFVMDEVGKSRFADVFEAAKPAFTSPFGWRCVPILTGTSGEIKQSSDAEKFFNKPDAYNFISRELVEEGNKKVSLFISGLRRMEGKYETNLGEYIQRESGIIIPADSELHRLAFQDSDFAKAEAVIDMEREQAAQSPDPTALLKAKMYYPKNTKELFLTDDGNNFPVEALREHIAYLEANEEQQGQPVKLYRDTSGKAKYSFTTNKKPLLDYPIKPSDHFKKDAAVMMFEPPMDNPIPYLYISGADPYNESNSKYSNSVGAVYIYKRMYNLMTGTFQRRIVASYVARPESLGIWHATVEMLLEVYGAVCMPENAPTFVQYFDLKFKGHYLADSFDFLKEISPKTSITGRPKGLPAIPKVQQYYKELVFQYLTEEVIVAVDEETKENITKLGLIRIPDIGLLRELLAFNSTGNFDRYVAFGHTLAHEAWADKIYQSSPISKELSKALPQEPSSTVRSPFATGTNNPFNISKGRVRSPFG